MPTDHDGLSFVDALKGAAKIQAELERLHGKPPKGAVSAEDFKRAIDAFESMMPEEEGE